MFHAAESLIPNGCTFNKTALRTHHRRHPRPDRAV